jgi:hypothetical protein
VTNLNHLDNDLKLEGYQSTTSVHREETNTTDNTGLPDIDTIYEMAARGVGLPPNICDEERPVGPAFRIKLLKRLGFSLPTDPPKRSDVSMPRIRARLMPRWDMEGLTLPQQRFSKR